MQSSKTLPRGEPVPIPQREEENLMLVKMKMMMILMKQEKKKKKLQNQASMEKAENHPQQKSRILPNNRRGFLKYQKDLVL